MVRTGLNIFKKWIPKKLRGMRIGLVVNPSSVDSKLRDAVEIFSNLNIIRLTALFGPQHGIRGETQDNMIEWQGFTDPITGFLFIVFIQRQENPLLIC